MRVSRRVFVLSVALAYRAVSLRFPWKSKRYGLRWAKRHWRRYAQLAQALVNRKRSGQGPSPH